MARAFNVLGQLEVRIDGIDVTPRAPKERSLLAMLVMEHGRVVRADRLIDELWPHLPVERARRVLWVRIAELRRALARGGSDSVLQSAPPGYRLAIEPDEIDAVRFAALVDAARGVSEAGDCHAAATMLREALALCRGEPLADAQGCIGLEAAASRLAEAELEATEDWIDAEMACGRDDRLHVELHRLVAAHPLRERLGRQRIVCLHRAGCTAEALVACTELRQRLMDELGVEPSDELMRLEHEILRHGGSSREPSSTPADRATPTPPHNLPVVLTGFVGRATELDAVAELMSSFRLVTLTGVGGVGKTRLALEAAASALKRHADGVWLVELAPLRDGNSVPSAVMTALGMLGDDQPEEAADMVSRALADRQVLLLLDNAEHVLADLRRFVHRWLVACPGVRMLVTSRELLHLPGEASYVVPPLALPPAEPSADWDPGDGFDAVELFRERAQAARPGGVTREAVPAMIAICRRVDGIPLAIELAAARTRMLGLKQIAERLDDCFSVLTTETAEGVDARHHALRTTLDWSHDLLAPIEQVALRRLSVFPGDFDLEVAVEVIEGTTTDRAARIDGFMLMSRLVDQSLVMVVGGGDELRYRLLEPIRQYAAEKLAAAGELDQIRSGHRDAFLRRSDAHWPLMTAQQRSTVYADRHNYVAALRWSWEEGDAAAALRLVVVQTESWMYSGDAECREWLERVLATPEPAVHPARARALSLLALTLHDSGCAEDAGRIDALLDQADRLAAALGDPIDRAACRLARVEIDLARGRTAASRSHAEYALGIYAAAGSPTGIAWCHHSLGWVALAENDVAAARMHFEQALEVARSVRGSEWSQAHVLAALAPVVALHGDPQRALRLASDAVLAARPFVVRAVLAMALARAGETAILAGEWRLAEEHLGELLTLLRDLATRRWAGDALEMVTVVLERRGAHASAVAALGASAALRAASGEPDGGVRAVAGQVRQASERLRAALRPDVFVSQFERARALPLNAVMADVLQALDAPT